MNRLLFAAARGARIEQYRNIHGAWMPAEVLPTSEGDSKSFRIHPDDEHLQYGPISTALRETAKYPPTLVMFICDAARCYLNHYKGSDESYKQADELHRSLFLLIMAEALADIGM